MNADLKVGRRLFHGVGDLLGLLQEWETEEDQELIDLVIQAQRVSQWRHLKMVSGWPTSVGGSRGIASGVVEGDRHRLRHLD